MAISTELYFGVEAEGTDGTLDKMFAWMEKDLARAQANRADVPWIVVHGHRSIYCSCDGDCGPDAVKVRDGVPQADGTTLYGMEDLLFKYGVDLFVNGHEHDYERSWPVYNGTSDQSNIDPKGTIYIVSGSAGSVELHEPFTRPQPEWSAFRTNTFGYSRMFVRDLRDLEEKKGGNIFWGGGHFSWFRYAVKYHTRCGPTWGHACGRRKAIENRPPLAGCVTALSRCTTTRTCGGSRS